MNTGSTISEGGSRSLFSGRALAKIMIPLLIQQLLAVMVGAIDTMMVSYAGESAVSGVSLVNSLDGLLIIFFTEQNSAHISRFCADKATVLKLPSTCLGQPKVAPIFIGLVINKQRALVPNYLLAKQMNVFHIFLQNNLFPIFYHTFSLYTRLKSSKTKKRSIIVDKS